MHYHIVFCHPNPKAKKATTKVKERGLIFPAGKIYVWKSMEDLHLISQLLLL